MLSLGEKFEMAIKAATINAELGKLLLLKILHELTDLENPPVGKLDTETFKFLENLPGPLQHVMMIGFAKALITAGEEYEKHKDDPEMRKEFEKYEALAKAKETENKKSDISDYLRG